MQQKKLKERGTSRGRKVVNSFWFSLFLFLDYDFRFNFDNFPNFDKI